MEKKDRGADLSLLHEFGERESDFIIVDALAETLVHPGDQIDVVCVGSVVFGPLGNDQRSDQSLQS